MRHPLALLHAAGVHAIVYLDDLCIWGDSPSQVQNSVAKTSALLTELGFLLNWQKSHPVPTTTLIWLGVIWDTRMGTWSVPLSYYEEIKQIVIALLRRKRSSRLHFEALIGKIAFAAQFSQQARLLSHELAKPQLIAPRLQDSQVRKIPSSLLVSLQKWAEADFFLVIYIYI